MPRKKKTAVTEVNDEWIHGMKKMKVWWIRQKYPGASAFDSIEEKFPAFHDYHKAQIQKLKDEKAIIDENGDDAEADGNENDGDKKKSAPRYSEKTMVNMLLKFEAAMDHYTTKPNPNATTKAMILKGLAAFATVEKQLNQLRSKLGLWKTFANTLKDKKSRPRKKKVAQEDSDQDEDDAQAVENVDIDDILNDITNDASKDGDDTDQKDVDASKANQKNNNKNTTSKKRARPKSDRDEEMELRIEEKSNINTLEPVTNKKPKRRGADTTSEHSSEFIKTEEDDAEKGPEFQESPSQTPHAPSTKSAQEPDSVGSSKLTSLLPLGELTIPKTPGLVPVVTITPTSTTLASPSTMLSAQPTTLASQSTMLATASAGENSSYPQPPNAPKAGHVS